ncbi:MAG: hypothetical protein QG604_72 [Candidatus Dependentiae bacterium]|nr:hypothetical protein [Candidatus Dependentiae bacterium]
MLIHFVQLSFFPLLPKHSTYSLPILFTGYGMAGIDRTTAKHGHIFNRRYAILDADAIPLRYLRKAQRPLHIFGVKRVHPDAA